MSHTATNDAPASFHYLSHNVTKARSDGEVHRSEHFAAEVALGKKHLQPWPRSRALRTFPDDWIYQCRRTYRLNLWSAVMRAYGRRGRWRRKRKEATVAREKQARGSFVHVCRLWFKN